jgi:site-specific DNA-methyltransferase (adenine-specific)
MGEPRLILGDCLTVMAEMEADSVDAVICDPPYLIDFMGKQFDRQHRALDGANEGQKMQAWHRQWVEQALRVLKPSHYLLAFGGTRSSHRLTCALEDAGFEVRDVLMWLYGSG